ncbi:uncharacterized protein LOC115624919 [Scaptodrosophila lebanonensis]|uniref:Uncharacterized protein LOC115624919 n=1 Tax=Drosophila lebanonensis TaxID=7225 RepID=A0A6J2THY8_DROLE|nr:uncharacterized protein LOC115624919 [Scaptodrosophila lebanonensis]
MATKRELKIIEKLANNNKKLRMEKNSLKMPPNEYVKSVLHMVSVYSIPLSIFDEDDTFVKLLQPWSEVYDIKLTPKDVVEYIELAAKEISTVITEKVKEHLVCVKLDMVAHKSRILFFIHIQYVDNFVTKLHSLGMLELKDIKTVDCIDVPGLKAQLEQCLQNFGINMNQVYSIMVDNGADTLDSPEIVRYLCQEDGELNDDYPDFEEVFAKISTSMNIDLCPTHLLHLAVKEVIKFYGAKLEICRNYKEPIEDLESPVKTHNDDEISSEDSEETEIDSLVKQFPWRSIYKMIENLKTNRPKNAPEHNFPWDFVENFYAAFTQIVECLNAVESKQMPVGDFFREWLLCEAKLNQMAHENAVASKCISTLASKKHDIIGKTVFSTALYIDPRYTYLGSNILTDEQKQLAQFKLFFCSNWYGKENESDPVFNIKSENKNIRDDSKYSIISKYHPGINSREPDKPIEKKIKLLQFGPGITYDKEILPYWEALKSKLPLLSKISQCALAIPATQFSIVRLNDLCHTFKAFANTSCRINLESILLLKLNNDLFKEINIGFHADQSS